MIVIKKYALAFFHILTNKYLCVFINNVEINQWHKYKRITFLQ